MEILGDSLHEGFLHIPVANGEMRVGAWRLTLASALACVLGLNAPNV